MDSCNAFSCPANREGKCYNDWGCLGYPEEDLKNLDLEYLRKLGKMFGDK